MSSARNRSTATMMYWMKKTTNAISDTGRKESVQVALLQTTASLKSDRSFIGAFLPDVFREIDQVFLYLSNSPGDEREIKSFCANSSISMHFSSVRSALSSTSRYLKSL